MSHSMGHKDIRVSYHCGGNQTPRTRGPHRCPDLLLTRNSCTLLLSCVDLPSKDPTEREEVERDDIPGNTRGSFATAPCTVFFSGTLGKAARYFISDLGFVFAFGFELGVGLENFIVTFLTGTERPRECEEDEDEDDADEAGEGMVLGKNSILGSKVGIKL